MRSPNGKAVGHRRCGQPTPTATPLRNAHVIEESDRGVRTERAHTKGEHYQAIVVLLREAIQYSEHGIPQVRDATFLLKRDLHLRRGSLKSKPYSSVELAESEGPQGVCCYSSRRCTISSSWWHSFLMPRLTIRPWQRGCPARTRDARGHPIAASPTAVEPQVAWRDELFERIGLRHREGNPGACREADRGHTPWIDEGLASQEDESPVGIRPAPEEGGKRARCAGVIYAARCIAVDEQDDIAPGDEFIGQPLLRRVMHPGTAVQSDDGGKRACAIGPGQIALYAVARNERARNEPLRGAFKLYALQRCGPCISHQRTYDAPKHQHDRGLESDSSGNGVPLKVRRK